MNSYAIRFNDDFLEHHGILGQKWGKKNGPPYPLDASDHSSAEKKAGWKKSLDKKKVGRTVANAASSAIKVSGDAASTYMKEKAKLDNKVDDDASKAEKKAANAKIQAENSKANSIKEGTDKASKKIGELGKEQVDLSNMSDEELRKKVNRLNMEQQYRNLTNTTSVKNGKDYVKTAIAATADIAIPIGTVVLAEIIKKRL